MSAVLRAATGDDDLSTSIGTGVWILSFLILLVYAGLFFSPPAEIAKRPRPRTTFQRWRASKRESKLQSAELRCGFVFAVIGGLTAKGANGSDLVTTIVVVCCAIVGGLIGFDVKRRVRRIREQVAPNDTENE